MNSVKNNIHTLNGAPNISRTITNMKWQWQNTTKQNGLKRNEMEWTDDKKDVHIAKQKEQHSWNVEEHCIQILLPCMSYP